METKKVNKLKWIMVFIALVMIAACLCGIFSLNIYANGEEDVKNIDVAKTNNQKIAKYDLNSAERIVFDFAGNAYILKEENNFYSITHAETGLLIEFSDDSKSPYMGYDKIWYCGPMSYYYEISNQIYSIRDNEKTMVTESTIEYCNQFNDFMVQEYNKQNREGGAVITYSNDKIDNYNLKYPDFFKNLNTSGYNTTGTCGYVAAASLLAYYDYCYGTNSFIKSNYWVSKSSNNIVYSKSLCNDLRALGKNDATTADSIKSVMKKYFEGRKQTNVKHYSWLGIFTTNLMLCDSIKKNNPVIIIGSLWNPEGGKNINHAVVVYSGTCSYINGSTIYSYRMHYGWGPKYNEIGLTNNVLDFLVGSSYYINIK